MKDLPRASEILKEQAQIPVTIVTGFLGSGKTTLLNHILQNQKGIRTAVLVNEFGEIGIDNDLIVTTSEDMVELNNGCICCSINGELLEAVENIIEKKKEIDYIIVETTGLADPLPIAMTFIGSELKERTRLDSIITVVDAENFNNTFLESEVCKSQLINGDILVINKCDLISEGKVKDLEDKISMIKKDPRILKSKHGEVPLPLLLSVGLFESDNLQTQKYSQKVSENISKEDADQGNCDHEHHHHHEHEHEHHHDIEGYTSLSFKSDGPFSLRKFQNFLDNQLPSSVFRAKGIIWFNESEKKYIFHLAGKRFTIDDSEWLDERKNQLVLIGKDLNHELIKTQLESCVAKNQGEGFA